MNAPTHPPLLFVDGYNIIGASPRLAQVRDHETMEFARQQLIEALTNYSAYQGFRTRIVFDAYTRQHTTVPDVITDAVSVHFTDFGQTADSCIEKWCADLRQQIRFANLRVIVATSDQAHRHTIMGYGAEWMSAHRLAHEIHTSHQQGHKNLYSRGFQGQKQRLSNVLKPAVQDRLKALRAELDKRP